MSLQKLANPCFLSLFDIEKWGGRKKYGRDSINSTVDSSYYLNW